LRSGKMLLDIVRFCPQRSTVVSKTSLVFFHLSFKLFLTPGMFIVKNKQRPRAETIHPAPRLPAGSHSRRPHSKNTLKRSFKLARGFYAVALCGKERTHRSLQTQRTILDDTMIVPMPLSAHAHPSIFTWGRSACIKFFLHRQTTSRAKVHVWIKGGPAKLTRFS